MISSGRVKESGLRISAFLFEHNISFNTVDNFVEHIKATTPVAGNLSCKRTKATAKTNNVLGKSTLEASINEQDNELSLMLDQSTNRSNTEDFALAVIMCNAGISIED
ncbi:hypothetical protein JTB14_034338 [Gonioctena quinquepunctata]|nr:hypothetical protein JTB14_034338 [Gonioctena quinquepunctata]